MCFSKSRQGLRLPDWKKEQDWRSSRTTSLGSSKSGPASTVPCGVVALIIFLLEAPQAVQYFQHNLVIDDKFHSNWQNAKLVSSICSSALNHTYILSVAVVPTEVRQP